MSQTLNVSEPDAGSTQVAFLRAVSEWRAGIGPTSNPGEIINHPAYRRIVGLGHAVVPYILHEIEAKPSLLVWALHEITGEDPVPKASAGKIGEMAKAWLSWGKTHNLL